MSEDAAPAARHFSRSYDPTGSKEYTAPEPGHTYHPVIIQYSIREPGRLCRLVLERRPSISIQLSTVPGRG